MSTTDKIMELIDEWALLASHDPLAKRHAIRLEIEALVRDAERLDWMIFHSAKVRHSSDGEFCSVIWYDDEGEAHVSKPFGIARQAIDAAMQEKQS